MPGAFHANGHPFPNEFQFTLGLAGQEIQEQPAKRRSRIKAFLGVQETNNASRPMQQVISTGLIHISLGHLPLRALGDKLPKAEQLGPRVLAFVSRRRRTKQCT